MARHETRVIEDDRQTADDVAGGRRQEGQDLDPSSFGPNGVELAVTRDDDVLVLDRMRPGFDGRSIVLALRSSGKDTPVLFLTSLGRLSRTSVSCRSRREPEGPVGRRSPPVLPSSDSRHGFGILSASRNSARAASNSVLKSPCVPMASAITVPAMRPASMSDGKWMPATSRLWA